MSNQLPAPLVPSDADLRTWPFMMVDTERLLGSDFAREGVKHPAAFRAGLLLLCKAWHQIPAGSLPDDDMDLAYFVRLDPSDWLSIRQQALRGWIKCSDGRIYHQVLADRVNEAWHTKMTQRELANRRWNKTGDTAIGATAQPKVKAKANAKASTKAQAKVGAKGNATPDTTASGQTSSSTAVSGKRQQISSPRTDSSFLSGDAMAQATAQPTANASEVKGMEVKVSEGNKTLAQIPENQTANSVDRSYSLFEEEVQAQQTGKPKGAKTSLPTDFDRVPSAAVVAWAEKNGYGQLDRHLAHFCTAARNRNYEYADWDRALMTSIRMDWFGIGKTEKDAHASGDGHSGFSHHNYAMGAASNTMSMNDAVRLMRQQQPSQVAKG